MELRFSHLRCHAPGSEYRSKYELREAGIPIYCKGGATRAQILDDRGAVLAEGYAVCSDNDNFCYRIGRDIAAGRALEAFAYNERVRHPRNVKLVNGEVVVMSLDEQLQEQQQYDDFRYDNFFTQAEKAAEAETPTAETAAEVVRGLLQELGLGDDIVIQDIEEIAPGQFVGVASARPTILAAPEKKL